MIAIDLFIIGAFIALLFFKQSRFASITILTFNVVYFNFVTGCDCDYYYLYSATLDTTIGVILYNRYRIVALLSFLLITVNYIGYLLFFNYYEPTVYDNIYLIIILMQITMLIIRGLFNGVNKRYKCNTLVFLVNFDSNKNHAKIQKTT